MLASRMAGLRPQSSPSAENAQLLRMRSNLEESGGAHVHLFAAHSPCVGEMHAWLLLTLLCIIALCSWLGGGTQVERSAWRAFDWSVHVLSQGNDDDCQLPSAVAGRAARASPLSRQQGQQASSPDGIVKPKRKRITPFLAKKVAARQHWRCNMCGELLTEDYEVDHIIPLHRGGSFDNDIDSLQVLQKRCHLLKNSLEQRRS